MEDNDVKKISQYAPFCSGHFLFCLPVGAINTSAEKGIVNEDVAQERIKNTRDYIFEQDGLYGIADKNGKIIVEAMFTDIGKKMEDNRLWVAKDGI